jgi:hypothetical protein
VNWPEVVSGALVGLLVGLTGVGGGSLMTPVLVLLFGIPPLAAVGTDLWFAGITKIVASRIYHANGLIDWPVVRRMWIGSITTTILTLTWIKMYALTPGPHPIITIALAGSVVIAALAMFFRDTLQRASDAGGVLGDLATVEPLKGRLTIAAGALLGVIVTLTSVGAAAIGAVLLAQLYPKRLTPARLVASDIVHAVPLTLVAGLGHLLIGDVDFRLLGTLLVGSVPGVILGAVVSPHLPHRLLRRLLAIILMLVSIKMISAVL